MRPQQQWQMDHAPTLDRVQGCLQVELLLLGNHTMVWQATAFESADRTC